MSRPPELLHTIGARVKAVQGLHEHRCGVIARVDERKGVLVRWDDGGESWYPFSSLVPESATLANMRVLP